MEDSRPVRTPVTPDARLEPAGENDQADQTTNTWYAKAIGSFMYAMLGVRPDIAFGVSLCSRFMGNPTSAHVQAVKRILRYLKETLQLELC